MNGSPILIAVDGSPAANTATARGLELAQALGSPVRFVHGDLRLAEELYDTHPDGPSLVDLTVADPVLADALERAEAAGVTAELELVGESGSVELATAVAGIATGCGAGLVVTGSRGRSPATGAVLGSVSHHLIQFSDVPVVVVHAS